MSDPFYRSRAWRELSAETLKRHPVCATRGCGRASTRADHIIPRSKGGPDVQDNLRGMCESCHNRRSAKGNAEPRAIGCRLDGLPSDPGHPFYVGEKSLTAGTSDRPGSRASTKFARRRGR